MASIYSRNGKIWISWYQNGKRERKSTELKDTKQNRKIVEKEILSQLTDYASVGQKVSYYYKIMIKLKEKTCKASTIERYDGLWDNHLQCFKDRYIDEITRSEIKQWLNELDLSPKSLRSALSVLSMIFDEAIDDEVIDKNLCKSLKLPPLKQFEPDPFSLDEIRVLMENTSGWFKNMLAILFLTGMRIGEAVALNWDDIQGDSIIVSKSIRANVVTSTKTGKIRSVPIFDDLRPYLKAQRFESGLNKRIFPKLSGAADLRTPWISLLKRCDMKHRILYQARHTFAINALDSGLFKISFIAKMLGHNSTQMLFQKYAKFIKSERVDVPSDFSVFRHNLGTKTA